MPRMVKGSVEAKRYMQSIRSKRGNGIGRSRPVASETVEPNNTVPTTEQIRRYLAGRRRIEPEIPNAFAQPTNAINPNYTEAFNNFLADQQYGELRDVTGYIESITPMAEVTHTRGRHLITDSDDEDFADIFDEVIHEMQPTRRIDGLGIKNNRAHGNIRYIGNSRIWL